jgi:hypothetical protein
MATEEAASFKEAMEKAGPEVKSMTDLRLFQWVQNAPMALEYCSITEKYCATLIVPGGLAEIKSCAP